MSKRSVAIVCGGPSAEHEVSLQSAYSVFNAIDRNRYEVTVIGIDQAGRWLHYPNGDFLLNADTPDAIALRPDGRPVAFIPTLDGPRLRALDGSTADLTVDVVFPVLHGTYGEDGCVQGHLKLLGIPFVGPSVMGSAAGMDKDVMKRLLREAGLPVAPFLVFSRAQRDRISFLAIEAHLGMPVFVKPCNLGSSVGIHKVDNSAELQLAVDDAFQYDRKIIIESNVVGREIECAVLGNSQPRASIAGEVRPTTKHSHYSYAAKYLDPDGAKLSIPAEISAETLARVQELAIRTFEVLCAEGLGRVDLFLKEDGALLVNEINTLPGFTRISMYPKLWAATGLPYPRLIDQLIDLAFERAAEEDSLKTSLPDGA